jgi:hypothetical protein
MLVGRWNCLRTTYSSGLDTDGAQHSVSAIKEFICLFVFKIYVPGGCNETDSTPSDIFGIYLFNVMKRNY